MFWPGILSIWSEIVMNARDINVSNKSRSYSNLNHLVICGKCSIPICLSIKVNQYFLLSDEYSKFPIIRKLTSTTSHAIINHLKSIFSEYGIPDKLVTDNGAQYSSTEFKQFATVYGFEHITSSPRYPQSNGSSERMVQTVEYILKKCDEDGSDPYLGLLSYRVTPISPHLESPSVLLNNRKFKTTLPMAAQSRVSDTTSTTKKELHR